MKGYTTQERIVEKRLARATKDSGELTREDKDLLKALLADIQAPEDIKVKCEGDDRRPIPLHFDMKNRLLVEGLGAKKRRIPYSALRSVQFGERNGHSIFQIEFEVPLPGESGAATYFMAEDSEWTAKAIAVEVREIIDSVSQDDYPLINFGVLKVNPQGKHQARLLQLDLPNRLMSNVHKGEIKSQFHFSDIVRVEDEPDTPTLVISFQSYRSYPLVCSSAEDKKLLLKILTQISVGEYTVSGLTHHDLQVLPFWPARAIFTGSIEKKGEVHWDKRFAVLTISRLFIFRQKGSRNPLNSITLLGTEVQRGNDDSEFVLVMSARDFHLRCESKQARDKWYTALRGAIEKASGNFDSYVNSVFHRASGSSKRIEGSGGGGGGGGGGGRHDDAGVRRSSSREGGGGGNDGVARKSSSRGGSGGNDGVARRSSSRGHGGSGDVHRSNSNNR